MLSFVSHLKRLIHVATFLLCPPYMHQTQGKEKCLFNFLPFCRRLPYRRPHLRKYPDGIKLLHSDAQSALEVVLQAPLCTSQLICFYNCLFKSYFIYINSKLICFDNCSYALVNNCYIQLSASVEMDMGNIPIKNFDKATAK